MRTNSPANMYEEIDWVTKRPVTVKDAAIFWAVAEGDLNRVKTIFEEDPSWIHAISLCKKINYIP